jgi:hypothetical protein
MCRRQDAIGLAPQDLDEQVDFAEALAQRDALRAA